jgi:hypothetical protein
MARRSKKKGDWLEAACAIGAAAGFVTGLQWPGKGLEKLYAGAAGAFIGAVLVLALSLWLSRLKKNPFRGSSVDRSVEPGSWANDPWPTDAVDQYPMWKETWQRIIGTSQSTGLDTTQWSLELLRALEWHRFEQLGRHYFEALGFRTELTPFGPDGGVDINLYAGNATTPSLIAQCKAWNSEQVGVTPVRELAGVMLSQKVTEAVFLTSSTFTEDAKSFARTVNVHLIDGADFVAKLTSLLPDTSQHLLRFATHGDFRTPTCPSCGIKMHIPKDMNFWGCANYPRCRHKFYFSAKAGVA